MLLTSVETTPNPNSMKLNVDVDLGEPVTYARDSGEEAEGEEAHPEYVKALLNINGIKSIFVCQGFVTLNKDPRADWRLILETATALFGGAENSVDGTNTDLRAQRESAEKDGQVHVLVQTFRGIPIQVKVVESAAETRVSLGIRFNEAAQSVQDKSGADFLKGRYWADYGVRYGSREEVAQEIVEEIEGLFTESHLAAVTSQASGGTGNELKSELVPSQWSHDPDWHRRLAAVQGLSQSEESLPQLALALTDDQPQVRRLAAAALGATGSREAVPALSVAVLQDSSAGVRRTAGDALSDIGDVAAQAAMCQALKDENKLVRWRAARFLSDIGTSEALPFLKEAADEVEFEVRLEIEAAIQRIQGGGLGMGPAWKRIIES